MKLIPQLFTRQSVQNFQFIYKSTVRFIPTLVPIIKGNVFYVTKSHNKGSSLEFQYIYLNFSSKSEFPDLAEGHHVSGFRIFSYHSFRDPSTPLNLDSLLFFHCVSEKATYILSYISPCTPQMLQQHSNILKQFVVSTTTP